MQIYFIAIGGTGMAPLACLLQELGHTVRGSDGPLYPPMSDLLAGAGIEPEGGFDASHLDPAIDLVVVGNAVHRDNVEAREAERLGLELTSMPAALARFFLDGKRPLVIAGTHGKTTTSSMAAWVYTECGQDPGFLIGGSPIDLPVSFHIGLGERFVIEGDEYNAAYFDRGPKFLHYRGETVILTNAEYDHVDLYPTEQSFLAAFENLIASIPTSGRLIACWDRPEVRALAEGAACPVIYYSLDPDSPAAIRPLRPLLVDADATRLLVEGGHGKEVEIALRVFGSHNAENALAVWAAARADGLEPERVADALGRFAGVKRRLEEVARVGGIVVVDDFAHHPTEVQKSIEGLRSRYVDHRVVVLFEPRSLSAGRSMFFDQYVEALRDADRAVLAPVFWSSRLSEEERLDCQVLAAELSRQGTATTACDSVQEVFDQALSEVKPGDVIATMSSGSFEGMAGRLAVALASNASSRHGS